MRNRLVILEGIPGSGKTTFAIRLSEYLTRRGIPATPYIEGDPNPIDLTYHAYLTLVEYSKLLSDYQQYDGFLRGYAIIGDCYCLVPYRNMEAPEDECLISYLESKEFCYSRTPTVPFQTFCSVFQKRFADFVDSAFLGDRVIVMESILMQHQIHDINRLYPQVTHNEIIRYLCTLSKILAPLDPVLFYISQD